MSSFVCILLSVGVLEIDFVLVHAEQDFLSFYCICKFVSNNKNDFFFIFFIYPETLFKLHLGGKNICKFDHF
jgi:hypothetical protein